MLNEQEPTSLRRGAYILEAVGTREDMPVLVAALNKLVPSVEKAKPEKCIGVISPVRKACLDLVHATKALAAREEAAMADPRTPGEVIHFVLAVKRRKEFRPAGWEKRCAKWALRGTSYVREVVVFNAPRPLPESLVSPYKTGVRMLIGSTCQRCVIHDAVQCGLDMKIPADEIVGMLADRLDTTEVYEDLNVCLADLVEGGLNDHGCIGCHPFPGKEEAAVAKAAWKNFLKDHGKAIREGKHFEIGGKEVTLEMFP